MESLKKATIAVLLLTLGIALYLAVSDKPTNTVIYETQPIDYSGLTDIVSGRLADDEAFGASLKIPDVRAFFSTTLQSSITDSATTFTLTSATDADGNTLASSTYAFVIDEGTASEEMVVADCTGTACTNATRGLSVLTGTSTVSTLKKSHRRGASVKITNGPQLLILTRLLQGIDTFDNTLFYTSGTGCSGKSAGAICDKSYVDAIVNAGAATSTESNGGIVELATQLEMASSTDGGADKPLVLQAKYATSTPDGTSASGLYVPVTQNNGKLSQLFWDLTEAFTWTAAHTWSALGTFGSGFLSQASSTVSGRFEIDGTSANPFVINSQAWTWPINDGTASSTVLSTDGSGNLTMATVEDIGAGGLLYASSSSPINIVDDTTETTLFSTDTVTLKGNILGTSGGLKARLFVDQYQDTGGNTSVTFRFKLGGTTVCTIAADNADATAKQMVVEFFMFNNGATNIQECIETIAGETDTDFDTFLVSNEASSAVDTTASQAVTVTAQWGANDGGDTETLSVVAMTIEHTGK